MRDFGLNKIFVEGKSDKLFIEALLKKYFDIDCSIPKFKDIVVNVNGKDNLKNQTELVVQERREIKAKNLIIFDADFKNKEGGYDKRKKDYEGLSKEIDVPFCIYLLPDNKQDGELEDLIKTCFKKEFEFFGECWNGMIKCFQITNNDRLNLPNIDGYIYSYLDLFNDFKTIEYPNNKTKINFLDAGLWDLDKERNKTLEKLVNFIENNFFE